MTTKCPGRQRRGLHRVGALACEFNRLVGAVVHGVSVVAQATGQDVLAGSTNQGVVEVAAHHVFDVGQDVCAGTTGDGTRAEVDRDRRRGGAVRRRVQACAAVEGVVAQATNQGVVAATRHHRVIARAAVQHAVDKQTVRATRKGVVQSAAHDVFDRDQGVGAFAGDGAQIKRDRDRCGRCGKRGRVGAIATVELIVAQTAHEGVVACASGQAVVACRTVEHVGVGVACQLVGKGAACQVFDGFEHIGALACSLGIGQRQAHSHSGQCPLVSDGVGALSAFDRVAADATAQGVVACSAVQAVVTGRAVEVIAASAADQGVGMLTAHNGFDGDQLVVAAPARGLARSNVDVHASGGRGIGHGVKAISTVQAVVAGIANQQVGSRGADHVFDVDQAVGAHTGGHAGGQVDADRCATGIVDRVNALAAVEGVVARATGQGV